jgi:hypothetical protein
MFPAAQRDDIIKRVRHSSRHELSGRFAKVIEFALHYSKFYHSLAKKSQVTMAHPHGEVPGGAKFEHGLGDIQEPDLMLETQPGGANPGTFGNVGGPGHDV